MRTRVLAVLFALVTGVLSACGGGDDSKVESPDTYADVKPNAKLDVARDKALTEVLDYLNEIKSKQHRIVGWARINVTKIEVTGDAAIVRDCVDDFIFELDESGQPLGEVTPVYETLGSLEKQDGRWLVTVADSKAIEESCKPSLQLTNSLSELR